MKLVKVFAISTLCLVTSFAFGDNHKNTDYVISNQSAKTTIPGVRNSAAHLTFTNNSDKPVKLVAAKSNHADRTELHEHALVNGLMKMQEVASIPVAPGGSVELKPGGYHVMFIGVKKPFAEGDKITFTLILDNGEEITTTAIAKPFKSMINHGNHKLKGAMQHQQ